MVTSYIVKRKIYEKENENEYAITQLSMFIKITANKMLKTVVSLYFIIGIKLQGCM